MYTFSNRLKIGSIILMVVGVLGIAIGFISAPGNVEEAKAMIASHGDGHGEEAEHATVAMEHGEATEVHDESHSAAHDEHVLHQLQNKPTLFPTFKYIGLGVVN